MMSARYSPSIALDTRRRACRRLAVLASALLENVARGRRRYGRLMFGCCQILPLCRQGLAHEAIY